MTACNSQNTNENTSYLSDKIENNGFYTILSDTIVVGKTIFNETGIKKINKDTVIYKNEYLKMIFSIFIKKIKGTDYIIQIDSVNKCYNSTMYNIYNHKVYYILCLKNGKINYIERKIFKLPKDAPINID